MVEKLTFFQVNVSITDKIENEPINRSVLVNATCKWDAMEKVATCFKDKGLIVLSATANKDDIYVSALLNNIFVEDEEYLLEEALNRGD